ncbi:hypothetical protein NVP1193O_039 [Vibrio phage 1.193.O._10N.286.52.C6]|nr:hypothetical protein NVP1193O_039 [Vibrio phage 1.193.O._10N.286.52.C6]
MKVSDLIGELQKYKEEYGDNRIIIPATGDCPSFSVEHDEEHEQAEIWV